MKNNPNMSSTKIGKDLKRKLETNTLNNIGIVLMLALVSACSMMGNKNTNEVENVPSPPKNLNPSNSTAAVVAPPGNITVKSTASATSSRLGPSQRIQEQKAYGGEVEEVKVNNINKVPPYYIYPKQSGVDANAPSSDNVATPNWKVSW